MTAFMFSASLGVAGGDAAIALEKLWAAPWDRDMNFYMGGNAADSGFKGDIFPL